MRSEYINAEIYIYNLPGEIKTGYMVARQDAARLWYYGTFDTEERAKEVAVELGNGVVIKTR